MKKNTIGIITFHDVRNYGAVLQAYALQRKLLEEYEDVKIIDYHNPKIQKELSHWKFEGFGVSPFLHSLKKCFWSLKKKASFDKFIRNYMLLLPFNEHEISKRSILIAGSDQIWNTELTADDKTYFLDFAHKKQIKIAYAASFGDGEECCGEQMYPLLKSFDLITLREHKWMNKLEQMMGRKVRRCCDPVLLLTRDEWVQLASRRLLRKRYVFCFMIEYSPSLMEYAKELCREKNMVLITNKKCYSFFRHSSPRDFLSWLMNADYVLTNSFHGTVFSVIFQKKFMSYCFDETRKKEKTRIIEFLDALELPHRYDVNKMTEYIGQMEAWNYISDKLERMRSSSCNYICDNLERLACLNEAKD